MVTVNAPPRETTELQQLASEMSVVTDTVHHFPYLFFDFLSDTGLGL